MNHAGMSLDVVEPEKVAHVLRRAAETYTDLAFEVAIVLGDEPAGKVWVTLARILDRAAASCERAIQRNLS